MSEFLKIVSSQYKHLPERGDEFVAARVIKGGSMLKNEPFSFQALYRLGDNRVGEPVTLSVDTTLPVECFRVDRVAVLAARADMSTGCYESDRAGLYPDVLSPRPAKPELEQRPTAWNTTLCFEKDTDAMLTATADYQAVWVTLNPESKTLESGEYEVRVSFSSLSPLSLIAEETVKIKVIDALLPKQTEYYTNWFYVDCVCDLFEVKPYSNSFYKIFDGYIKNMVRHRQNTLLLPAFTPPLDTAIGDERMNVQLVEIEKTPAGWKFGFEKMRRFVRRAKKCGIEFFEHCHLFSQWGAKQTPNIYTADGKRIFGFDTDACGEEYVGFIRAYLTEFFKFAKSENIDKKLIFHISDEPKAKHLESYRAAHGSVADLLCGNPICDAMSDLVFYSEGLVDQPILHVNHMTDYTPESCSAIWLYYTGGEINTSNRKITNTAAATRVIGVHMYKYGALGFLHWAYNYCYDRLSVGFGNPTASVNTYKMIPGICNLCYPIKGRKGTEICPSIREKLMCEAFDDLRALKLLESKIGREATLALCEKHLGQIDCYTVPAGDTLRLLREEVNRLIEG